MISSWSFVWCGMSLSLVVGCWYRRIQWKPFLSMILKAWRLLAGFIWGLRAAYLIIRYNKVNNVLKKSLLGPLRHRLDMSRFCWDDELFCNWESSCGGKAAGLGSISSFLHSWMYTSPWESQCLHRKHPVNLVLKKSVETCLEMCLRSVELLPLKKTLNRIQAYWKWIRIQ